MAPAWLAFFTRCVRTLGAHSYTVTTDNTSPVPVCVPYNLALDSSGMGVLAPANVDGGSGDSCAAGGALTITVDRTNFGCGDLGDQTVILSVDDGMSPTASTLQPD